GPLASAAVRVGQQVAAGHLLGATAGSLHFSVRLGEVYLDPALLLAGRLTRVELRLVPAPLRPGLGRELTRQQWEARGDGVSAGRLLGAGARLVAAGGAVVGVVAAATVDGLAAGLAERAALLLALADVVAANSLAGLTLALAVSLGEWWDQRGACTPRATP